MPAYSAYSPQLYQQSAHAMQQSYQPNVAGGMIGSAASGDCPQGSPVNAAAGQPCYPTCVSGEIPVNQFSGAALQNPPVGGLSQVITQAYLDTQAQTPVTGFNVQCCPNPAPCQEEIAWRASFKGCPYTYADDPRMGCEVNPVGDRYMVGDLDPLLYERRIMQEAQPNPYAFMNARQLWMQFLMKDWVQTKDPYCRPIPNLDQSFCLQQNTRGPPAYTVF